MFLKLLRKELIHYRLNHFLIVLTLFIGIFGFVGLDLFRESFVQTLGEQARKLMSSDLQVSSRRQLTDEEKGELFQLMRNTPRYELVDIYSMLFNPKNSQSRLAEVRILEPGYPFYGEVQTKNGRTIFHKKNQIFNKDCAYVSKDLKNLWGLAIGDKLILGGLPLEVCAVVFKDTTTGIRGFSLAPRVYVAKSFIEKTSLVRVGTTGSFMWHFKLNGMSKDQVLSLKNRLSELITDPAIKIQLPQEANERLSRTSSTMIDYLKLCTLIGYLLSLIGLFYLFKSYLNKRVKDFSRLRVLGVRTYHIAGLVFAVFSLNFFVASFLGIAGTYMLAPFLFKVFQEKFNFHLTLAFIDLRLLGALLFMYFLALISILGTVLHLLKTPLSRLLQFNLQSEHSSYSKSLGGLFVIVLSVFVFFSTQSYTVSLSFVGALVFGSLLIYLSVWGIFALLDKMLLKFFVSNRLIEVSIKFFYRKKVVTTIFILSFGLGVCLISFMANLEKSIATELTLNKNQPGLFLFDIQDDQLTPLKQLIEKQGAIVQAISPLIRAKLESVNGKKFERPESSSWFSSKEEQNADRFKQRTMNLSIQSTLNKTETLIKGKKFPSKYDLNKAAPLSVEYRFAKRLGLEIGDILKFDILGVPIEMEVFHLRSVKWTSFRPNFFLNVYPGYIEQAPKSHILTIRKKGDFSKAKLQNSVVEQFPNISIIDVEEVINELLKIFSQMYLALLFVSSLTILIGIFVMLSIFYDQGISQSKEVTLLKILGFSRKKIFIIFSLEFFLSLSFASFLGVLAGYFLAAILSQNLFDLLVKPQLKLGILTYLFSLSLSLVVFYLFVFRSFRFNSARLLEDN